MGSIRCRSDNRLLFLDFRYRDVRCREQTALPDTPTNRKRLQKVLERIDAEIATGTFEYRRYFPTSRNATKFDAPPETASTVATVMQGEVQDPGMVTPLFGEFAETWYAEKEVEWRRSYRTTMRQSFDRYLLPRFGEKAVGRITKADVLAYRAELGKVTARGKQTTLSAARINKMLNPLRQILDEAADRFDFRCRTQHPAPSRTRSPASPALASESIRQILCATVLENRGRVPM